MNGRQRRAGNAVTDRHKSRFVNRANLPETLGISESGLGQSYPRHYPYSEAARFPLGEPMDIEDVAALLGCSPWTVRQKYLPAGLPHIRASRHGRIVFFREQVIDWILERQRKEDIR